MKTENIKNLTLTKYKKGYGIKANVEFSTGVGQVEIYTTTKNKEEAISIFNDKVKSYGYKLEAELNDIEELTTLIRANRKGSK